MNVDHIRKLWFIVSLGGRVGVLTASSTSLTENHFKAVGAGVIPIAIMGMERSTEFREVILVGLRDDMDIGKIEADILDFVKEFVASSPDIGALVLECTDWPPYAHQIQKVCQLPIFDLTTLATMVHNAVYQYPYS